MRRRHDGFPAYVPVARRRRQAANQVRSMQKAGRKISPVEISGRAIATTFWGEAWCDNLEAYSDFENRLPRGRTYVRNGSVVDLQIEPGRVRTLVSGSDLYTVDVRIKALAKSTWTQIKARCAGQIGSLVELLGGSLSRGVMEVVTRKQDGLFPSPQEITLACSCPDYADMCKHVAATLYGVGARLDQQPELLFTLRGVDPAELVEAAVAQSTGNGKARKGRVLETDGLSALFGIDLEGGAPDPAMAPATETSSRRSSAKKTGAAKKVSVKKRAAATPKKGAAKKVSAKKRAAKKIAAKKVAAKKTTTRVGASAKKAPSRKRGATESSKKASSRNATARQAASARKPVAKKGG